MARTDEPTTAPEVRPLGVTVLPSFQAAAKLAPVAEPAAPQAPAHVPPFAAVPPRPEDQPAGAAEVRGPRALLRRRPGRAALVAVPDPVSAAPEPVAVPEHPAPPVAPPAPLVTVTPVAAPASTEPANTDTASADVAALQAELVRERQRADSAEAANAVLRRRVAQLDDELAQFRPRAIVPFEDNTD